MVSRPHPYQGFGIQLSIWYVSAGTSRCSSVNQVTTVEHTFTFDHDCCVKTQFLKFELLVIGSSKRAFKKLRYEKDMKEEHEAKKIFASQSEQKWGKNGQLISLSTFELTLFPLSKSKTQSEKKTTKQRIWWRH